MGKAGLRGMGLSGKFGYFCSVRILLAHQINRVSGLSSRYKAEVLMLGEIRICYVCMFFYKKQKKRKSAFNQTLCNTPNSFSGGCRLQRYRVNNKLLCVLQWSSWSWSKAVEVWIQILQWMNYWNHRSITVCCPHHQGWKYSDEKADHSEH